MIRDLFDLYQSSCVLVEEGIDIYDIEYILLFDYGYSYYNSGDRHQDTQFKIGDISDGKFRFHLYKVDNGDKYVHTNSYVPKIFEPKITFSSKHILREYKINNIKRKILG